MDLRSGDVWHAPLRVAEGQLHQPRRDLAGQALAKLPVVPTPSGWRAQPIAADEVAARLVELALGDPQGRVPDVAGPEIHTCRGMIREYLDAVGSHRPTMPVRVPGGASRAYAAGGNLAPDRAGGKQTWAEFLAEHVARR